MDEVSVKGRAQINRLKAKLQLKCIACSSFNVKPTYQEGLGVLIECNECEVIHTK